MRFSLKREGALLGRLGKRGKDEAERRKSRKEEFSLAMNGWRMGGGKVRWCQHERAVVSVVVVEAEDMGQATHPRSFLPLSWAWPGRL